MATRQRFFSAHENVQNEQPDVLDTHINLLHRLEALMNTAEAIVRAQPQLQDVFIRSILEIISRHDDARLRNTVRAQLEQTVNSDLLEEFEPLDNDNPFLT